MQYKPLSLVYQFGYPFGTFISNNIVNNREKDNGLEIGAVGREVVEHRVLGFLGRADWLDHLLNQLSFI
jgi:hypothetical protein